MKFILLIIFLVTSSMTNSQNRNSPDDRLEELSWLSDRWVYTDSQSVTYENWVMEADNSLTGESFTVKNGETVFSEQLRIEKKGDDVFYIAAVEHNPGPVDFKLVELGKNKAVFENPEHDFPNRIIYELKNSDSLYARVEGKNNRGESIIIEYSYTRAR